MKIGIDFDSTVAKIDEPWLKRLNALCGTAYRPELWTDWELTFIESAHRAELFKLLTPDLYEEVAPYPGAATAIRNLAREAGVELVCVTSNPERDSAAFTEAKKKWLRKYIPELSEHVISAKSKSGLGLDILIDDAPHHHEGGDYISVLVRRPWNKRVQTPLQFENWNDGQTLILGLIQQNRSKSYGTGRVVSAV